MKTRLSGILVLLLFSCAPGAFALKVEYLPAAPSAVPAAGGVPARGREVASGRAFVRFEAGVSSAAAADTLSSAGFKLVTWDFVGGWSLVGLPEGMSVSAALPVLLALPGAAAAEPSGVYRVKKTSNDPALVLQYGLRRTDALRAWDFETGSSSRVTVAVLDTGIDSSHPDLASKLVSGASRLCDNISCVANDPSTAACNHATRVAGVAAAAADNSSGIAGLSWGARLISLKVFSDGDCNPDCSDKGGSACATDDAAMIKAINYAVTLQNSASTGRIVLNMSLGNVVETQTPCSGSMQTAITAARTAGLVVIAAAGNDPRLAVGVNSPGNCTGVVPVGATDSNDSIAFFSAYDSVHMSTGVSAPGVGIYTTDLGGAYAYADGTSFASPLVAGLAALIISAKPAFTSTQVADTIRNTADELGNAASFGRGRVNAYKAMMLAVNGSLSAFAAAQAMPKAYAYPNPFRPGTGRPLSFSIPDALLGSDLKITIYTTEGEKVKKLSTQLWDGTNEAGQKVASGIYIFFIKTDKGTSKGKFALLR
ncbi:MAG: hypothetical protein A2X28_05495 [Elusimicrobia bacterium GWA2_56_46]|nr:MAG: hypothetical protein A2X28_05495 [Elusimicrobia bacterium GWA2_56_46]OGR55721.1 MAG: hypothetical protein A2X39_00115 [Elusimicrobia bacterium GWC2_56_31]HBB68302.1 hypothetical protein [Elusimicrobiota bacterium]HBW23198.1 hypothetical protein [Elusimicrobiota bacterium]